MSHLLEVRGIQKSFGTNKPVLTDISFSLDKGKILTVIGNSGGGKSTLLNLLAGFDFPDTGEIYKNGIRISSAKQVLSPASRKIGIIFQDYALFPHLTVDQNIRFGYSDKTDDFLNSLYYITRLGPMKNRFPRELSGGEQQRVAIARSVAARPDILLMDEPFSSIDVLNRERVREELKNVLRAFELATVLVTHDYRDAMYMADEVMVLRDGRIVQTGSPAEVYSRPFDGFVARLFGTCNVVPGMVQGNGIQTPYGILKSNGEFKAEHINLLIRPNEIDVAAEGSLSGMVSSVEYLGSSYAITVSAGGENLVIHNQNSGIRTGEKLNFEVRRYAISGRDTAV